MDESLIIGVWSFVLLKVFIEILKDLISFFRNIIIEIIFLNLLIISLIFDLSKGVVFVVI